MWQGLAGMCEDGTAREKAGGGGGGGDVIVGQGGPRVEEANVKALFEAEKSYKTILTRLLGSVRRSLVVRDGHAAPHSVQRLQPPLGSIINCTWPLASSASMYL